MDCAACGASSACKPTWGWLIERLRSSVIVCTAQQLHMPGRTAVPAMAQHKLLSATQVARLGSFGAHIAAVLCG